MKSIFKNILFILFACIFFTCDGEGNGWTFGSYCIGEECRYNSDYTLTNECIEENSLYTYFECSDNRDYSTFTATIKESNTMNTIFEMSDCIYNSGNENECIYGDTNNDRSVYQKICLEKSKYYKLYIESSGDDYSHVISCWLAENHNGYPDDTKIIVETAGLTFNYSTDNGNACIVNPEIIAGCESQTSMTSCNNFDFGNNCSWSIYSNTCFSELNTSSDCDYNNQSSCESSPSGGCQWETLPYTFYIE